MRWLTIVTLFLVSARAGEALVRMRPGKVAVPPKCERLCAYPALSRRCGRVCMAVRSAAESSEALLARLRDHPDVELAAPNDRRRLFSIDVPEDPRAPEQWGLDNRGIVVNGLLGIAGADIGFPAAWRLTKPNPPRSIIAVMDTGVDYRHPDLAPNMWINPGETPRNGIDDDGNGVVDDVHGFDAAGDVGFAPDGDPMDAGTVVPHGTHIAGVAAAVNGNGIGGGGVYPAARIMAIKVSEDGFGISSAGIVGGIDYILAMRDRGEPVVVVNASFGGGSFNALEFDAFRRLGEEGVLIVAAAGNDGANNDVARSYPANYPLPEVISVAATDARDRLAGFSNFGENSVDIAAPGDRILSTWPTHIGSAASVLVPTGTAFSASGMIYSGLTPADGIQARLVHAGLGRAEDFPADTPGTIALIDRGELFFSDKIDNATAAGAVGVIVANNESGSFRGSLRYPSGVNIPAVAINQADGQTLAGLVGREVTLVNAYNEAEAYVFFDGTSMAAPMVAGAVAMAADHFPGETAAQRRDRVLAAAATRPGLQGSVAGGRRLGLVRVLDTDGNDLPDWWEMEHAGGLGVLAPGVDSDRDDLTDRQEFLVGSDPLDPDSGLRVTWAPGDDWSRIMLEWPSLPGRSYRVLSGIEAAPTVLRDWTPATPPRNQLLVPRAAAIDAFRVQVRE